jgi:glutamate-1-semialdehyde 2,1-aminomutase
MYNKRALYDVQEMLLGYRSATKTRWYGMNANTSLASALIGARESYVHRNPTSARMHCEACAGMPGGNTRSVLFYDPFPLVFAGGQGAGLTDVDGHVYLDFLGEYSAGLYGHSHPVIRAAIEEALDRGISLSGHSPREPALADAIRARFPSINLLRFTNSGSEANLFAVATAKVATGREKILVFSSAYHGGLLNFAAGGIPINAPHDFILGRYNDLDNLGSILAAQGDRLAAILVEPMLGSGGCIPADPEFLAALRQGAAHHGAILIFDEVMTSRLAPGGAQELYGIVPDLTTLGKYMGGGLSFGAFGGRRDLMERYDPRRPDALTHAGTFNNNVLSMAAGHAGLTKLFTPDVVTRLAARGDDLRTRLNAAAEWRGIDLQFTGRGSLMSAHFTGKTIRAPDDLAHADARLKELFFFDLLERGFYIARRGMLALSLMIDDAACNRFVDAVEDFLDGRNSLLLRAA